MSTLALVYALLAGVSMAVLAIGLTATVLPSVATAGVNLFTLFAYASGLRITSSFVIGGTSTILMVVAGTKLFAIGLIAVGTFLLQRADI